MSVIKQFEFFRVEEKLPDVSEIRNRYVLAITKRGSIMPLDYSKYGFNTYDSGLFEEDGKSEIKCVAWAYLPEDFTDEFFPEEESEDETV